MKAKGIDAWIENNDNVKTRRNDEGGDQKTEKGKNEGKEKTRKEAKNGKNKGNQGGLGDLEGASDSQSAWKDRVIDSDSALHLISNRVRSLARTKRSSKDLKNVASLTQALSKKARKIGLEKNGGEDGNGNARGGVTTGKVSKSVQVKKRKMSQTSKKSRARKDSLNSKSKKMSRKQENMSLFEDSDRWQGSVSC